MLQWSLVNTYLLRYLFLILLCINKWAQNFWKIHNYIFSLFKDLPNDFLQSHNFTSSLSVYEGSNFPFCRQHLCFIIVIKIYTNGWAGLTTAKLAFLQGSWSSFKFLLSIFISLHNLWITFILQRICSYSKTTFSLS